MLGFALMSLVNPHLSRAGAVCLGRAELQRLLCQVTVLGCGGGLLLPHLLSDESHESLTHVQDYAISGRGSYKAIAGRRSYNMTTYDAP